MLRRLLSFFRRRRVAADPGEVIALDGVASILVWDVWIDVGRDGSLHVAGAPLATLPVDVGRYRIEVGPRPRTLVVRLRPSPDLVFRGPHSWFCESECTPLVGPDFLGIALAAPTAVSVSESLEHDWASDDWAQNKVPRFVVAGYYSLSAADVLATGPGYDTVTLEVENPITGGTHEETVDALHDRYQHEVIGLNVSPDRPATPPEGFSEQPQFTSIGGYFNAQMGLYVTAASEPYELRVSARCGPYVSDAVTIRIEP